MELAPDFVAAWFLLGQAEEGRAERDEAAAAFGRAAALDPEDVLGAKVRLAQLGIGDPASAMSPAYIRELFDEYAIRFDRHLRKSLAYRGPELLHDAVLRACSLRLRDFRFGRMLDLGCGTGLVGEVFRGECREMAGIDLSPAMVKRAQAKMLYDDLAVGDLVPWLHAQPAASAELVIAADVFVYLADLAPVFAAARRALAPAGLFAFTVQAQEGHGVLLGPDGRYAHGERYLCDLATSAGFASLVFEAVSTRQDRGSDVPGYSLVLSR